MRAGLNQAVAFARFAVNDKGDLTRANTTKTLPEAQRHARDLRAGHEGRSVHPDLPAFCGAELLADKYFHAVQEP